MRATGSYRIGPSAGDQRLRSDRAACQRALCKRALLAAATAGMLASGSLGCSSPQPPRWNSWATAATAEAASSSPDSRSPVSGTPASSTVAGETAGGLGDTAGPPAEDPQLTAAFARLEQARAEAEQRSRAAPLPTRLSQHVPPTAAGASAPRDQAWPASPGGGPASIPVWSGIR